MFVLFSDNCLSALWEVGVLVTLSFIFLPQNVFENLRKPFDEEVVNESEETTNLGKTKENMKY